MTIARDIMTAGAECVRSSDTVVAAAQRMAELNVGALPICGEDGLLKGILTDRDIVLKVVAQRKDPLGVDVGELAEGAPVTVEATDDVRKVMSVMSQHQIRRVPVLDNNRLVGMIAQSDVATSMGNAESGSMVEGISTDF